MFYSPGHNFYDLLEMSSAFKRNGFSFFTAGSFHELYNILNIDTKLVIIDQDAKDDWLEFNAIKRSSKNVKFVYFKKQTGEFLDLQTGAVLNRYNLAIYLKDKNKILDKSNDEIYFVIKNLLSELGLKFELSTTILTKIIYKIVQRDIKNFKDNDLFAICFDIGVDPKTTLVHLNDFLKKWQKENKFQVYQKFPIFRGLYGNNFRDILKMFVYCFYDRIYKIQPADIERSFNLLYQITMFEEPDA